MYLTNSCTNYLNHRPIKNAKKFFLESFENGTISNITFGQKRPLVSEPVNISLLAKKKEPNKAKQVWFTLLHRPKSFQLFPPLSVIILETFQVLWDKNFEFQREPGYFQRFLENLGAPKINLEHLPPFVFQLHFQLISGSERHFLLLPKSLM